MSDREYGDALPDELEPGSVVASEVKRLVEHPRLEAARLNGVADEGEAGSTVLIEIAKVARFVVPIVLIVAGAVLGLYLVLR
ncbi:MAG: hypothetical protein QOG50_2610 [Actinomycetota bacterium]|jgi:hypothetical protein|nr:hypothetical protein [Actinomycetota bacterium]